eukprot:TRINITY_DN21843_c0_g3_i3.p1 TRINITY_DN21843_c0_g3~~TRINITY_DN21843_c0_g3_i3.p1  ORF type:complete len:697 (+),score=155.82 TRINITY_DN21843_c0_g3_i3:52-2142(+)
MIQSGRQLQLGSSPRVYCNSTAWSTTQHKTTVKQKIWKKNSSFGCKGGVAAATKFFKNQNRGRLVVCATSTLETIDSGSLEIEFVDDNVDYTELRVTGPDEDQNLLLLITGALNSLDLTVVQAQINTDGETGVVKDVFFIVDKDGQKLDQERYDETREHILQLTAGSSRSRKPAIYGIAAGLRLRPLSIEATEGSAAALELAAAEMAQAAGRLVQIENQIIGIKNRQGEKQLLDKLSAERAEAAAQLERRMSAMEAVLSNRRSAAVVAEPEEKVKEMAKPPKLTFSTGPAAGSGYEIILQAFNWESCHQDWYKILAGQAAGFAAAGFTAVWLPPPTDSVSPQGYLPRDLYDLNCQYGSEGDLRDCISLLHENNLMAIADIVVNHRCAHQQGSDGKWNVFGGRLAWDATAICCNDHNFGGRGKHKSGELYAAAPNIDHTNQKVQKDIIEWLNYLRNSVGFDGWRFDFVKGYSAEFTKMYVDSTVPSMAFGEFWDTMEYSDGVLNYNQDNHRQRTVDWIDTAGGTVAAFDFTTKGILQEAVSRNERWRLVDSQGRPAGSIGMWPSRSITFIENHDTGSTLQHWPFPWDKIQEGYAYILTHPGTPCVFYDHFWSEHNGLRKAILELLQTRKKHAINFKSKVSVCLATNDTYAATIDDKIAMKMGTGNWSPNSAKIDVGQSAWSLCVSGHNFAVWEAVFN